MIRRLQLWVPSTSELSGDRFFVRSAGGLMATPLLWALLMAEWSDLVFAIDSIPVVLSVSRDPFVVFTSNAFVILGIILCIALTFRRGAVRIHQVAG